MIRPARRGVPAGSGPAWPGRGGFAWPGHGGVAGFAGSVLVLVLLVAGCSGRGGSSDAGGAADSASAAATPSPFADCAGLTGGSGRADLPDVRLPCFTGGQSVRLTELRGPAVVNVWATWCAPCRTELPAMQRLADRAGDKLRVIGVDTGDSREAAASFGADVKVKLPTLYDRESTFVGALGRTVLPVTVFIDASGKKFVYNQAPLDEAHLVALVREHTGVEVSG